MIPVSYKRTERSFFISVIFPQCTFNIKTSIAKVAEESESNGSGLNSALVTDLIDKQSIAYAVKTFSENVESALRKNDADKEATFCSLVRNWYHSEAL
jgi:hypothetical protein